MKKKTYDLKIGDIISLDGRPYVVAGTWYAWAIDFDKGPSGIYLKSLIYNTKEIEVVDIAMVAKIWEVDVAKVEQYIADLPLYTKGDLDDKRVNIWGRELMPGDIVPIYTDPVNMTRPEGFGKLIKKVPEESGETMERWWVEINGMETLRFIKIARS